MFHFPGSTAPNSHRVPSPAFHNGNTSFIRTPFAATLESPAPTNGSVTAALRDSNAPTFSLFSNEPESQPAYGHAPYGLAEGGLGSGLFSPAPTQRFGTPSMFGSHAANAQEARMRISTPNIQTNPTPTPGYTPLGSLPNPPAVQAYPASPHRRSSDVNRMHDSQKQQQQQQAASGGQVDTMPAPITASEKRRIQLILSKVSQDTTLIQSMYEQRLRKLENEHAEALKVVEAIAAEHARTQNEAKGALDEIDATVESFFTRVLMTAVVESPPPVAPGGAAVGASDVDSAAAHAARHVANTKGDVETHPAVHLPPALPKLPTPSPDRRRSHANINHNLPPPHSPATEHRTPLSGTRRLGESVLRTPTLSGNLSAAAAIAARRRSAAAAAATAATNPPGTKLEAAAHASEDDRPSKRTRLHTPANQDASA